ncbi:MAG: hypothetical protein R3C17_10590 [Planctomycetaceae bacterium]
MPGGGGGGGEKSAGDGGDGANGRVLFTYTVEDSDIDESPNSEILRPNATINGYWWSINDYANIDDDILAPDGTGDFYIVVLMVCLSLPKIGRSQIQILQDE